MKTGLVLSGGGARGIAHLGVMEALLESGVNIDVVSGSSAGALAGSLFCAGHAPGKICEFIRNTNFLTTFRPSFNTRSLLNIERAKGELIQYFEEDSFESLKVPLRVSTTEVESGRIKVFSTGEIVLPVLASCCIPVVFDPIKIGETVLVDGGILDNMPWKPIRQECDHIIALHCNPIDANYRISNWSDLMERSMMLSITQNVYNEKNNCDIFLEPPMLSKYSVFDFKKAPEIFNHGYDYAKTQIGAGVLDLLKN